MDRPHSLDFGVLEGLGITSAPSAHKVLGDGRVEIDGQILILEVTLLCSLLKLSAFD